MPVIASTLWVRGDLTRRVITRLLKEAVVIPSISMRSLAVLGTTLRAGLLRFARNDNFLSAI